MVVVASRKLRQPSFECSEQATNQVRRASGLCRVGAAIPAQSQADDFRTPTLRPGGRGLQGAPEYLGQSNGQSLPHGSPPERIWRSGVRETRSSRGALDGRSSRPGPTRRVVPGRPFAATVGGQRPGRFGRAGGIRWNASEW